MRFKISALLFVYFFIVKIACSQSIFINSPDELFSLNEEAVCTSELFSHCRPAGVDIFSTAIFKDTIYVLFSNSGLYSFVVGRPWECKFLTNLPGSGRFPSARATINSLTTDKNGIIYGADGATNQIIRYNPYTDQLTVLGSILPRPGGDLIFYKDKLLLATLGDGIYEINLVDPLLSTQYMQTGGYTFYGLISVPFDCKKNKYYGLSDTSSYGTRFIELDLENKVVIGEYCTLPLNVYDAASSVDNGNTIGVTVNEIALKSTCTNDNLANVTIKATSASNSDLTYWLNGVSSNKTGIFNALPAGLHSVSIVNEKNCRLDTTFTVFPTTSLTKLDIVDPLDCGTDDGSIAITVESNYTPVIYRLNNGSFQANSRFDNLTAGEHKIIIRDGTGCEKDTMIFLSYQKRPEFVPQFNLQPTLCDSKTGGISLKFPEDIVLADIKVSLNRGLPQQSISFSNLDEGRHLVSIFYKDNCRFDTLVTLQKLLNKSPEIMFAVTDQQCFLASGKVDVSLTGNFGPYVISFNNESFVTNPSFSNLNPGIYTVRIRDKNLCYTDTLVEIKPYHAEKIEVAINKTDPLCTYPNSGQIATSITGYQSPYKFKLGNTVYNNNEVVRNLKNGKYTISILNNDNCVIDSVIVELKLLEAPECDYVFIPNAFTPNNDNINDVLSLSIGTGVSEFEFSVYNRWGEELFFTNNRDRKWDGKYKGAFQSSGVYIWTLRYKTYNNPQNKHLKGTLNLIR
ncbi:gliding motility-associated C-terminal domain-containing protein [Terrimonas rubra]|uniref:Gliding motility-associated C-terminal domain-containing protein n=1 Tax=Terrimonas rubra TaxID=1035890 RepID=A0ABW6A8I4_9BACT